MRTNKAQLKKAQETYLRVLKQQEEVKKEQMLRNEEISLKKNAKMEFDHSKAHKYTREQLIELIGDNSKDLRELKREEKDMMHKIEAYETIKNEADVQDSMEVKREVDGLKIEYKKILNEYNKMKAQLETQKTTLYQHTKNPRNTLKY